MNAKTLSFIGLLLCIVSAHGQGLRGFYKNFTTVNDDGHGEDVQRVRLKLDVEPAPGFDLRVHYETRLSLREEPRDVAVPFAALQPPARFFDFEKTIAERDHSAWHHQLDRLRLRYQSDAHEFRVGRQAVSWGSGLVWTPTDIFAGFSPLEIDRDDKPGVDVLRWTWSPGGDASVDLVYEPRDDAESWRADWDDSALAARAFGRLGEFDLALMGGKVGQDDVLGGDFTGYLVNAGVRGEWMHTFAGDEGDRDFSRALLGVDYSFPVKYDPYLSLEYYYNGLGAAEPQEYLAIFNSASVQRAFLRGNAFNLGRHYLGLVNRFTLTALTGLSTTTLYNLEDHSLRSLASVSWSAAENIDVLFGCNVGWGAGDGEFQSVLEPQSGQVFAQQEFLFGFVKVYF